MTDDPKDIGEGSYEGARDYREKTETFLAKNGKVVPSLRGRPRTPLMARKVRT